MGVFDSHASSPGNIRIEGENITIKFDRTGPNTGRVSWNIPPPAAGCTADSQAYCGMLVTLDTQAASVSSAPVNGTLYTSDPTGDTNLHAGDKIGTSVVVGAFYEGEKKGKGEELTTFFDISGLDSSTPYFISGYAVDCVNRYHTQGVFAYSQNLGGEETPDTSGTQVGLLNGDVVLTDGTGLTLGETYLQNVTIDGTDYELTIDGTDGQTYADLIEAVNNAFEQQTPAPQTPLAPNTNAYYYETSTGKLFQWDGSQHIEITVLNEPTDPTALSVGNYWYDTANDTLNQWDGTNWILVASANIIKYLKDPISGLDATDFWYQNGSPSAGYQWCGNVWCQKTLFDQTADPTSGSSPTCSSYWFNSTDGILNQWNETTCAWQTNNAIYWDVDPSALVNGTYWFNDGTEQKLYQWDLALGIFNPISVGYQDVILDGTSLPYTLDTVALPDGSYTDDILINGNAVTITLEICNTNDGKFKNVFAEINKQLVDGLGSPEVSTTVASVAFRDISATNVALRITSESLSPPVIQAGGNLFSSIIDWSSNAAAVTGTPTQIGGTRPVPTVDTYWVDTTNEEVEFFSVAGSPIGWTKLCTLFFDSNPTDRESCDLWWNSDTDVLNIWDAVANAWTPVTSFVQSSTDPAGTQSVNIGDLWHNPTDDTLKQWDGSTWLTVSFVSHPTDPSQPVLNDIWFNPTTNTWMVRSGSPLGWVAFNPVESPTNPSQATIPTGTFWYDTLNEALFMWNGVNWVSVIVGSQPLTPVNGEYWYNTTTNTLMVWNGTAWVEGTPLATVGLVDGNLLFTSTTEGSSSKIELDQSVDSMLQILTQFSQLEAPLCGTDGLESTPMYVQQGVGTDGSSDERRNMADTIRRQLGYPTINVELDKEQIDTAITIGLKELRRRSGSGYHRGFMKLPIRGGIQRYQLSNKAPGYGNPDGTVTGYDKIVQVMGVFRTTSAFMTSAHGSGVFGQVVLQHLYNMGTFDLLSFHLVSQYVEQLEHLFASRIVFNWNESDRTLWLHQSFAHNELAIMDVAVERTEQELLLDRYTGRWIERWALAQSRLFLSEIRGKYATYAGAGGGISLNAADLKTTASEEFEALIAEVDNYQVNNVEEFGQGAEFVIG